MKKINTINELSFNDIYNSYGKKFYILDEKITLKTYRGYDGEVLIEVTDLSNAQKRGATCTIKSGAILEHLNDEIIIKALKNGDIESIVKDYRTDERKASTVYTPKELHTLDNWKKAPKNWNFTSIVKAYYNNKIKSVYRKGRYTDDYAFDAATNFGKGTMDIDAFIEDEMYFNFNNTGHLYKETEDDYIIWYGPSYEHYEIIVSKK